MLHDSLELALEEGDGLHDAQLLQRANVSPFLSSAETATSLTRVPSLCDFSLHSEATANHTSSHFQTVTNAWDLFLEGKAPHGGRITYAIKTPTANEFPVFVQDDGSLSPSHGHGDPTALSPIHTEKKVLVSEHDLRLEVAASDSTHKWEALMEATTSQSHYERSKTSTRPQAKLFPVPYTDVPIRPRRVLLSEPHDHSGYTPYTAAVSPRLPRFPIAEDATVALRLPALSKQPSSAFQLMDHLLRHSLPIQGPSQANDDNGYTGRPPPVVTLSMYEYAAMCRARSMYYQSNPPRSCNPSERKIGIYSPAARRERLRRFSEKRKQRVFRKRTQYDCRQRLANACPRIKGRFVCRQNIQEETSLI